MSDREKNTDSNSLPEQENPELEQLKQENELLIAKLLEMKKILNDINK